MLTVNDLNKSRVECFRKKNSLYSWLYMALPRVILPEMNLGCFWVSAMAAMGIPQLAKGPQKWVLMK